MSSKFITLADDKIETDSFNVVVDDDDDDDDDGEGHGTEHIDYHVHHYLTMFLNSSEIIFIHLYRFMPETT